MLCTHNVLPSNMNLIQKVWESESLSSVISVRSRQLIKVHAQLSPGCSDVLHSGARDIILASQSFHQELTCNTSEVQRGCSLLIDLARSSLAENFRNEGRKSSFILVWCPEDSASSSLLPWFWLIHYLIKFVWWKFCFCGGWHARRCLNHGCH